MVEDQDGPPDLDELHESYKAGDKIALAIALGVLARDHAPDWLRDAYFKAVREVIYYGHSTFNEELGMPSLPKRWNPETQKRASQIDAFLFRRVPQLIQEGMTKTAAIKQAANEITLQSVSYGEARRRYYFWEDVIKGTADPRDRTWTRLAVDIEK